MTQAVVIGKNAAGRVTLDICGIEDWDGFAKIVAFLKLHYAAQVVASYDGPDARRWILKIGNEPYELIHENPYGNDFVSTTAAGDALALAIGRDLQQRLGGLPPV